jgi:hypothetical protein
MKTMQARKIVKLQEHLKNPRNLDLSNLKRSVWQNIPHISSSLAQQPNEGQGRLIPEVSSHTQRHTHNR